MPNANFNVQTRKLTPLHTFPAGISQRGTRNVKQKKETKAVRVKSGVRNAGSWNKSSTSDPETVVDVTFPRAIILLADYWCRKHGAE